MVRTPSYDRNGMKKGAWSPEEDGLLRTYITKYGHWNWRELPKFAGLKRCGKSCRLRWMNYLRPDHKHGNYTKQEEDLIIQLHQQHGNKWAVIASNLPGRTDNEIKNHWHTHLKKRPRQQKPTTPTNSTAKISLPKPSGSDLSNKPKTRKLMSDNICHDIQILESCPFPSLETPLVSMSTCTTPMSSELSTCNLSSFDISTAKFDDDGGLEELMNSSELFTELSSLSPLELDNEIVLNIDHQLHTTSSFTTNRESETSTGKDVCGEIEFQDEDFWCNSLIDTNQVLLSPFVNYYDDNLLDFFCHQSQIMEDFPYKVNTPSFNL